MTCINNALCVVSRLGQIPCVGPCATPNGEWGSTANNQRARYYHLVKAGRAHLAAETTQWVRYADTVTSILTSDPGPA